MSDPTGKRRDHSNLNINEENIGNFEKFSDEEKKEKFIQFEKIIYDSLKSDPQNDEVLREKIYKDSLKIGLNNDFIKTFSDAVIVKRLDDIVKSDSEKIKILRDFADNLGKKNIQDKDIKSLDKFVSLMNDEGINEDISRNYADVLIKLSASNKIVENIGLGPSLYEYANSLYVSSFIPKKNLERYFEIDLLLTSLNKINIDKFNYEFNEFKKLKSDFFKSFEDDYKKEIDFIIDDATKIKSVESNFLKEDLDYFTFDDIEIEKNKINNIKTNVDNTVQEKNDENNIKTNVDNTVQEKNDENNLEINPNNIISKDKISERYIDFTNDIRSLSADSDYTIVIKENDGNIIKTIKFGSESVNLYEAISDIDDNKIQIEIFDDENRSLFSKKFIDGKNSDLLTQTIIDGLQETQIEKLRIDFQKIEEQFETISNSINIPNNLDYINENDRIFDDRFTRYSSTDSLGGGTQLFNSIDNNRRQPLHKGNVDRYNSTPNSSTFSRGIGFGFASINIRPNTPYPLFTIYYNEILNYADRIIVGRGFISPFGGIKDYVYGSRGFPYSLIDGLLGAAVGSTSSFLGINRVVGLAILKLNFFNTKIKMDDAFNKESSILPDKKRITIFNPRKKLFSGGFLSRLKSSDKITKERLDGNNLLDGAKQIKTLFDRENLKDDISKIDTSWYSGDSDKSINKKDQFNIDDIVIYKEQTDEERNITYQAINNNVNIFKLNNISDQVSTSFLILPLGNNVNLAYKGNTPTPNGKIETEAKVKDLNLTNLNTIDNNIYNQTFNNEVYKKISAIESVEKLFGEYNFSFFNSNLFWVDFGNIKVSNLITNIEKSLNTYYKIDNKDWTESTIKEYLNLLLLSVELPEFEIKTSEITELYGMERFNSFVSGIANNQDLVFTFFDDSKSIIYNIFREYIKEKQYDFSERFIYFPTEYKFDLSIYMYPELFYKQKIENTLINTKIDLKQCLIKFVKRSDKKLNKNTEFQVPTVDVTITPDYFNYETNLDEKNKYYNDLWIKDKITSKGTPIKNTTDNKSAPK